MKRIHPPIRETLSLLLVGAAGVGCGATDDGEKSTSRDVANQEESTPMAPQPESTETDQVTAETDVVAATETDEASAETDVVAATETDVVAATETDVSPAAPAPTPSVVDEMAAPNEPVTRCPDPEEAVAPAPVPMAMFDAGTPESPIPAVDPTMDVPGAAYPDCGDAGYPDCIRG